MDFENSRIHDADHVLHRESIRVYQCNIQVRQVDNTYVYDEEEGTVIVTDVMMIHRQTQRLPIWMNVLIMCLTAHCR